MDLLQIGEPGQGKKKIWVIARQHPGETLEAIGCGLMVLDSGTRKQIGQLLNKWCSHVRLMP